MKFLRLLRPQSLQKLLAVAIGQDLHLAAGLPYAQRAGQVQPRWRLPEADPEPEAPLEPEPEVVVEAQPEAEPRAALEPAPEAALEPAPGAALEPAPGAALEPQPEAAVEAQAAMYALVQIELTRPEPGMFRYGGRVFHGSIDSTGRTGS